YASHWKSDNRSYRILTKSFGLRFIISVSGKGGKFDIITLTLNIGSIIGIFGLATVICDIAMLHLCRNAHLYKQHIFQRVDKDTIRSALMQAIAAVTPKQKDANGNNILTEYQENFPAATSITSDDDRSDNAEVVFDRRASSGETSHNVSITNSPSNVRPLVILSRNAKTPINDRSTKRLSQPNGRVKFQIPTIAESPQKIHNLYSNRKSDDINNYNRFSNSNI
ncbi:unnamed protein product, partial [Didymodactylos carnosus]